MAPVAFLDYSPDSAEGCARLETAEDAAKLSKILSLCKDDSDDSETAELKKTLGEVFA